MVNLKWSWSCALTNFRKWKYNPTIYAVLAIYLTFALWYTKNIRLFCTASGMTISPWVLPFYIKSANYLIMYVGTVILLFASAPFATSHTPYVQIRTGRLNWFVGQILYISMASLVIPLLVWGSLVLSLLPVMRFSLDWGGVIRSLAQYSNLPQDYGLSFSISFNEVVVDSYSGISATLLTIVLMWVSNMLLGCTILFFNVAFSKVGGSIAGCLLLSWSAFAASGMGAVLFGENTVQRYAVLMWSNPGWLAPVRENVFTVSQALLIQFGIILLLLVSSVWIFYRKDSIFEKNVF